MESAGGAGRGGPKPGCREGVARPWWGEGLRPELGLPWEVGNCSSALSLIPAPPSVSLAERFLEGVSQERGVASGLGSLDGPLPASRGGGQVDCPSLRWTEAPEAELCPQGWGRRAPRAASRMCLTKACCSLCVELPWAAEQCLGRPRGMGRELWCCPPRVQKLVSSVSGSPAGASGKEAAGQCRSLGRLGLGPWVGKLPWRRKWCPTPVFLPEIPWSEEPGGLQSMGSREVGQG